MTKRDWKWKGEAKPFRTWLGARGGQEPKSQSEKRSAQRVAWPWRGPRRAGQNQSEQIEMCFLLESLGNLNVRVGLPEEMGIGNTKQPAGHE